MPKNEPPIKAGDLASYAQPDVSTSVGQILNSHLVYVLLWGLSYWLYSNYGYLASLPASLVASLFLVRVFIIQHDCGHGSFFSQRGACTWVGRVSGLMTFAPYDKWRADHNTHHANVGKLEGRGVGDVDTLTVAEYQALPPDKQRSYRLYRNPWLLFTLGPTGLFVLAFRFTAKRDKPTERASVHWTNLGLLILYGSLIYLLGWRGVLAVQGTIIVLASTMGVWLFYVQHQFERTYWRHTDEWSVQEAALYGSSYYHLPPLLQWLSGNIGLHHVHHANARIPNYKLQACQDEVVSKLDCRELTLATALHSLPLALWDEDQGRLISFKELAAR